MKRSQPEDSDSESEDDANVRMTRQRLEGPDVEVPEENIQDILEAEEDNPDDAYGVKSDDAAHMPGSGGAPPDGLNRVFSDMEGDYTRVMVVVDTSGVHELPVVSCACHDSPPLDIQLLRLGLYPATTARPKTLFTFRVLDDVLLTTKECKTSIQNYYNKLRRVTDDLFPHSVPVRLPSG